MKNLLLIIDLQKDFINENTRDMPIVIEKLLNKNLFDYVAFTKFINDDNSQFYKVLNYKGCITEESKNIINNINNGVTV